MPGRASRVRLQVENSRLDGLLFLVGKTRQSVGDRVSNTELRDAVRSELVLRQRAANLPARISGHLSNARPQLPGTTPR